MWEQEVPAVGGECGIRSGEDGEEVVLECADGAFSGIAAMDMRRD